MCLVREYSPLHVKCARFEFHHRQSREEILVRFEQVVIIDFSFLAKDQALRAGIVLRRAAFNLVAQRVLALVGVGKIDIIHDDHACRQRQPGQQQWNRQPIKADAAGLARNDFVVLAHHAQRNQYRHQRSQRRQLIQQIRSQVPEVIHHD